MSVSLSHLILDRPLAVLDLESTGVDPAADRIVEVAVLTLLPGRRQELFHRRINPGVPIPPAATAVHGIADADVAGVPPFAALALAGGNAHAQGQASRITGAGVGPSGLPLPGQDPRPHWVVGVATHLGLHCGEGAVRTDSAALDPTTGKIAGEFGSGSPFVFRGADGDELVCHYGRTDFGASKPGTFELTIVDVTEEGLVVEALWIAEFVPQSARCTGKFAGVTGSWVMYARSSPFVLGSDDPVYYSWEGAGRLKFAKP